MIRQRNCGKSRGTAAGGCRGFTLIEVLIAVVILAVGIVGILQALHGALEVWEAAVDRTRSVMLVRERLTEIQLGVSEGTAPETGTARFAPPHGQYRWWLRVEPHPLPGIALAAGVSEAGDLFEVICEVRRETGDRGFVLSQLVYVPPPDPDGGDLLSGGAR